MQTRFKVGDVVTVHKPKNINQHPGWTQFMDRFDGDNLVIKALTEHDDETVCSLRGGTGYLFNVKWLEVEDFFEGNV